MDKKVLASMAAPGIGSVPSIASAQLSANAGWVGHNIVCGFIED